MSFHSSKSFRSVAFSCISIAVFSYSARANEVLLSAPSAGLSYYGMYCDSCIVASFTLSGTYDVSTIDVVVRTPSATAFTTFDFSLQSAIFGSFTTYADDSFTVPLGGPTTEALTVGKVLSPGVYYLVGNVPGYLGSSATPGDVDGWYLSTGTYIQTAGAVANGLWEGPAPGKLVSGDYYGNGVIYTAPAFTVNGSPVSATVPEPSTWAMLIIGFAGLGFAACRRQFRNLNDAPAGVSINGSNCQ